MEKILRTFDDFESAEQAERSADAGLSYQDRFRIFMPLMAPYYASSPGFQRVYRVDDLDNRSICDGWGIRGDTPTTCIETLERRVTSISALRSPVANDKH